MIDQDRLGAVLAVLESLGLLKFTDSGYIVEADKTHLPIDSPLYRPFRVLQRLRTLERLEKLPTGKAYSFSVVFSSEPAIKAQI